MVDGKQHTISVTWDNTNGDVKYFVDGQLAYSSTGYRVGSTTNAVGTLVLGQDQDIVGGGFNSTQRFSGTLHELRVWDRAISAEQVSQNYQQKLGTAPTGLVADWRMSGFNGSSQVVDSIGGVNLSIGNATGAGFATSTPTATLAVAENATVGTVVGSVMTTDAMNSRDIVNDGLFREGTVAGVWSKIFCWTNLWRMDSRKRRCRIEWNGRSELTTWWPVDRLEWNQQPARLVNR